jgi:predicted nicotinamide N-methyase
MNKIKHAIPRRTEAVDLSGNQHSFAITCHAIRADAAGVFFARYVDDPAGVYRKHTVLLAGSYVVGHFAAIRTSGTTIAAADLLGCEFPLE